METIVRTAGMVQGTPDWQLDRMYENESDRIWAEQNTEQPEALDFVPVVTLVEMHRDLVFANDFDLNAALYWIENAMNRIHDTPEYDRLASIYDAVSDLRFEIKKISDKAEQSWRKRT
jgi:hypothetical protein